MCTQSSDFDDIPWIDDCQDDEPIAGFSTCILCGQANVADAPVCRLCGIVLTGDRRAVLAEKRKQTMRFIAQLEESWQRGEPDQDKQRDIEAYANLVIRLARNLILVGVVLLPIAVGVVPFVVGAYMQHAAIKARDEARFKGEMISQLVFEESRQLSKEYSYLQTIDQALERLGPA